MRYYTYAVGAALIRELAVTHAIRRLVHDGGDLIHVQMSTGQDVMIYLIERPLPTYELNSLLREHSAADHYTLFLLWGEMLLPDDGVLYTPDEWMRSLLALYGDKIFAYDVYMGHLLIFPVHFLPTGNPFRRLIRHGDPVDVRTVGCDVLDVRHPGLVGTWRLAAFYDTFQQHTTAPTSAVLDALAPHYRTLGLDHAADRVAVKRAYRALARVFHPDLNSKGDATHHMQTINVAYDTIMAALDRDA